MKESKFIFNKECVNTAYVLGFLWADGWLQKRNNIADRVNMEILETDGVEIKSIFENIGVKLFYTTRKRKGKNLMSIFSFSDICFIKFLIKNQYNNRKIHGFYKIMENFTPITVQYFIRGLFDGDGCFYRSFKNSTSQISLSSSLEQSYNGIEKFLKSQNINYNIQRVKNKHSYSSLRITSRKGCLSFINAISKAKNFGLYRKNEKIKLMEAPSTRISQSKFKAVVMYDKQGTYLKRFNSIKDTAKDGFTPTAVSRCCHNKLSTHKKRLWRHE